MGSDGDRAVDGATVVQAVVHARLLGLRLLTLDARVVVAPAELEPTSLDLVTSAAVDSGTGRPPPPSVDGGVSFGVPVAPSTPPDGVEVSFSG